MKFSERMKELLDQGMTKSKDFAVKAGAKAQDMGERGIMMLEIKQQENLAKKLIGQLGNEAYKAFTERGEEALSKDNVSIKKILYEISLAKESIEHKEDELKLRKNR